MRINDAGLSLIKEFEGCKLKVYKDLVGLPTVGYGHMDKSLTVGDEITQEQADEFLRQDLKRFEDGVCQIVRAPILAEMSSNQFSALVALSYNIGLANLHSSLLLRCINMNNSKDAADQFLKWDHAGGQVIPGLLRRRQAERQLFLS